MNYSYEYPKSFYYMRKHLYMLACIFFLAQPLFAQTPIIFKPGPGLNDGTDEGGANGGKDAYVSNIDNIAHGIEAGFATNPISNCNTTDQVSFLKFDVSSLPAEVDSVLMVIHHFDPQPYCFSNCIADFHFGIVTEPWSETTITFYNPPAIAANPFYSFINLNWDDSLKIKEYNITETYRDWRDETVPNHGFEIYSTTVGCNNACVYIGGYTSDDTTNAGEYRPYLKIYENTIGIESMLAKQMGLHCYPNPATNEATLEFSLDAMQNITVDLLDVTGRLLSTREYATTSGINKITFSLSDVNAGLYYYRLKTNSGKVSGKLMKK